jgi:hypothetical protein
MRRGAKAKRRWRACSAAALLSIWKERRVAAAALFDDLRALYRTRFNDGENLHVDMASPHLAALVSARRCWPVKFVARPHAGPRRRAARALHTQLYAEKRMAGCHLAERQCTAAAGALRPLPDALNAPGKGMELRLIQTLVAHHRGAIELASRPKAVPA